MKLPLGSLSIGKDETVILMASVFFTLNRIIIFIKKELKKVVDFYAQTKYFDILN